MGEVAAVVAMNPITNQQSTRQFLNIILYL